jgi:hypothetical protein
MRQNLVADLWTLFQEKKGDIVLAVQGTECPAHKVGVPPTPCSFF